MATELDTRFWLTNTDNRNNFLSLISVIKNSGFVLDEWKNLTITRLTPGNKELSHQEIINFTEIKNVISNYPDDAQLKYTIYVPLQSWRFSKLQYEMGHVMMAISTWGSEYGKSFGFDNSFEGNAQISVLSIGPFCEIIDNKIEATEINKRVSENLEVLLELFQKIIEKIDPSKIQTYSDLCDYTLSNSHLFYFRDFNILKDELLKLLNILKYGNESYDIPSISNLNAESEEMFFHKWRNKETRQKLKTKLKTIAQIDNIDISNSKILDVLKSGKYDYFDKGESILILEYPFFMNAFIDQFICDLLL